MARGVIMARGGFTATGITVTGTIVTGVVGKTAGTSPHFAGFFFAVKNVHAVFGRLRLAAASVTSKVCVGEKDWRPSLDLNQDKKLCTAPA
jgi:hypothetical protein